MNKEEKAINLDLDVINFEKIVGEGEALLYLRTFGNKLTSVVNGDHEVLVDAIVNFIDIYPNLFLVLNDAISKYADIIANDYVADKN